MSLRGFSGFEGKLRAHMAKAALPDILVASQMKNGLTNEEEDEYLDVFKKFDTDCGGSIDSKELGKLVRMLG